jgi:hypothetical protein
MPTGLKPSCERYRPDHLSRSLTNLFTGEPIRFEASPGNVILRPHGDRYELIWHDLDGAEAITNDVPASPQER